MASKADKQPKLSANVQLRRGLAQASKSLQVITSSLEKLESSFIECETVISREKVSREEILALREKVDELQKMYHEAQRRHEQQITSFGDTYQALAREYDRRCAETLKEYEVIQDDHQRQLKSQEQEWKQRVAAEKTAARREMENGSKAQRNVETELRKALENQQAAESRFQKQQRELFTEVTKLRDENNELERRLTTREAVSTGKNAEIQILESRLASIEAFRIGQSTDE